jgi:carboxylesterase type B
VLTIAIGDLRFASPQPAEYGTTINATAYGPSCPQSPLSYASVYGDLAGPYGQSEDCLQLNVFVPRDVVYIATGLPVMVFVPGGGFFGGSAYSADGSIWLAAATAMVSLLSGPVRLMAESTFRICDRPA